MPNVEPGVKGYQSGSLGEWPCQQSWSEVKGATLKGLLGLAQHSAASEHGRVDLPKRFRAHVVDKDICYTLVRSTDTTTSSNLALSIPCMGQGSDDQAGHLTTVPQTLRHLATRTHLPF